MPYFRHCALACSIILGATHLTIASDSRASIAPTAAVHGEDLTSTTQDDQLKKKLKIAVGRFTNETRYGRSLLRDGDLDPLGKQALDILSTMLTDTDHFLVFERPDMAKIEREQARSSDDQSAKPVIGVDTLVLGSIVEFGRSNTGKRGLFNRRKDQTARATVTIRLVDVATGLVFHSATGSGEATTSAKTTLGVGSTAAYDQTLNDRAISAAINQVINDLVETLDARPWRTDLLSVEGDTLYLAGGKSQGLKVGDVLTIYKTGKTIRSRDTGFDITLPPTEVAQLRIKQLFGDRPQNEGSIAELLSGSLQDADLDTLYVAEDAS